MMKYVRGYLIGILSTIILLSSISIFADNGQSAISVALNRINTAVNGNYVAEIGDSYTFDNGTIVPFSILYTGQVLL